MIINKHLCTVIKAEIVTQEMINLEQSYMFPDNSDNMTSFTGRNIHVVFPSMLLKDVLNKLPQSTYIAKNYNLLCQIIMIFI